MEKADTMFAVGEQWRPALRSTHSGNVAEKTSDESTAPLAMIADNNDHRKWNLTTNHRHPHTVVTGVITPGGANPDGQGNYDALTSVLSTSWEEGDESYFYTVPLDSNRYFPLTGVNPSPDHGGEQYDTCPDSREGSRVSLLRSTRSPSEEFERQKMPAKPAPTAVPDTTHERGGYGQGNTGFEIGPDFHGIQLAGTQQHESGLNEMHQSKKLQKPAAGKSHRSLLTEKLRRKR